MYIWIHACVGTHTHKHTHTYIHTHIDTHIPVLGHDGTTHFEEFRHATRAKACTHTHTYTQTNRHNTDTDRHTHTRMPKSSVFPLCLLFYNLFLINTIQFERINEGDISLCLVCAQTRNENLQDQIRRAVSNSCHTRKFSLLNGRLPPKKEYKKEHYISLCLVRAQACISIGSVFTLTHTQTHTGVHLQRIHAPREGAQCIHTHNNTCSFTTHAHATRKRGCFTHAHTHTHTFTSTTRTRTDKKGVYIRMYVHVYICTYVCTYTDTDTRMYVPMEKRC